MAAKATSQKSDSPILNILESASRGRCASGRRGGGGGGGGGANDSDKTQPQNTERTMPEGLTGRDGSNNAVEAEDASEDNDGPGAERIHLFRCSLTQHNAGSADSSK